MLKNCAGLVLLDALWHHVQNIVHNRCAQLEVEVAFNALLGYSLGDSFAVATFELAGKEIAQPTLEKRNNTAKEEQPDSPARSPNTDTGTLTDRAGVESVQIMSQLNNFELMDRTGGISRA